MMKARNVIGYGVAVVLGTCVLGRDVAAQEIEWERFYSQGDPLPRSGTYYSGRHIQRLSDGGYVVTSVTGSGGTAAVARFDSEGIRLWDRGITDEDTNLFDRQFTVGESMDISLRFSYEREDGRIVFFGNVSGSGLGSSDYGGVYQLVLDEGTGEPLDTLAGWPDSTASLDNGSAVCRVRDGRFVEATVWPYSQNLDTLGRFSITRLSTRGSYDNWFHLYSVGERREGEEVYHYPWRVIQMPDGGFVIYGVRAVVNGPATLFLLNVDSLGNKKWEAQTQPETVGRLSGAFFDTTSDGGFILLGTVSYEDATADRKRWRVMRLVKFSAGGAEEWSRDYESERDYTTGRNVRQTSDGGYLLLGTVGGFNETYTRYLDSLDDGYLLKVDGEGREEWGKVWGGPGRDSPQFMLPLGDGSVMVTGNGGESDQLYLAKIRIGTAGVGEEKEAGEGLRVLPNPARDRLRVVVSSPLLGEGMKVHLYDLLGRDVLGRSIPISSYGSADVEISVLPTGAYRVVVEGEQGVAVRSVVVVR